MRLCRGWFQDVPRRGFASAASAVNRQHYTGRVDNGTTIRVLEDAAGHSSTSFESRNTVSSEEFGADGR